MDSVTVEIYSGFANMLFSLDGVVEVKPDSDLRQDLGVTSLELLELRGQIEDHFDVCIDDTSHFTTFIGTVNYIKHLWVRDVHPSMMTV